MNKILVGGILIVALAMVVVAYAVYTIISPTISVTVGEYRLELSTSSANVPINTTATLNAILLYSNAPVGENYTISFYKDSLFIGSNTTDTSGNATLDWNATTLGTFEFHAEYDVT